MNRNWNRVIMVADPVAAAFAGMLAFSIPGVRAAERPDLSGTWKVNELESDDPRAKMREAWKDRGPRGGGHGGGGQGGHGGMRGGGRRGGVGGDIGHGTSGGMESGPEGGMPGEMPGGGSGGRGPDGRRGGHEGGPGMSFRELDHLTIAQTGATELVITDQSGRRRQLRTDGLEVKLDDPQGGTSAVKAQWKGDMAVIETRREGAANPEGKTGREGGTRRAAGGKIEETYELAPDGKQLHLTVSVEGAGPRPSFRFRRVYDRTSEAGDTKPINQKQTTNQPTDPATNESGTKE